MKRILLYSHDTFGLGNIRRMFEIARHLVEASPDVCALVLTGSPMTHALKLGPRLDSVKLPCLSRDVDGRYGARLLPLVLRETVQLRANLIRSTLLDFKPDLMLVDKKPFGVEDELAGALDAIAHQARRPRMVLLLRDILDAPQTTRSVWRKNGYFEAIEAWYDRVLVVGSEAVFDLGREYDFPPHAARKLHYCGYLERAPGARSPAQVRASLGLGGDRPLVLATPGGGEDGSALVEALLQGWIDAPPEPRAHLHVVCGPEMAGAPRERVHALALRAGASVQDHCDDMMALHGAAAVVVCMGGYNTLCELMSAGRRAVVVPRSRPGLEQSIRAERLHALGVLRCLPAAEATPQRVMQALRAELGLARSGQPVARLPRYPGQRGLPEVTRAVLELLEEGPCAARGSHDRRRVDRAAAEQRPSWPRQPRAGTWSVAR